MWQGNLELGYVNRDKKTILNRSYATAPLKVQRSFYPEGDSICHTVILHTAGGVVGGDYLDQKIRLDKNTRSLITTASAGKIYRSQEATARQVIEIEVGNSAYLEWLPQETIVFNGAKYRQDVRINLGEGAGWLGWDLVRFGRSARGERFLAGEWRSNWQVYRDNIPLWIDRSYLLGGDMIGGFSGLNNGAIIGTLVYIGQPVPAEIIDKIRSLEVIGETGTSSTLGDGVICRYRGNSRLEARDWFIRIWHLLRGEMMGMGEVFPRVWLSW